MIQLKKIDFLFFGYVFITSILLFFSWNTIDKSLELFLTRGLLLGLGILLIYFDSKTKNTLINLLRNCYPILFSMLLYTETVFYNKLFFNNLDQYLIDLDFQLFGFQPSIKFSEHFSQPFFSELMYLGYFSLYILIISFVFISYIKLKKDSEELFFKLAASMLLFYLFFCFFPAAGPQFYFESPKKELPTAFVFDKIMHLIQKAEQPTGAFPSSHVGISLIILVLFRKRVSNYFKIAFPFVILLILSTVYIKAHYAVDAIAGIISVPIVLFISNLLYKKIPDFKL
ncbi:phosphatase PAP2 family protein [Polaribacter ponticola]|uniref:Phosphatase PAP2 family protein n=1 Tax=Polaribacter ponticola TaxID=2978475 RepID=A0ABT5S4M3_9FLAO|nr:phosphatase PAP2 family protein [Polaribacter sp. MSW5]MDD7913058.1 phosphatase PAP2 family protein [Polaribacter sp. MSW5]